MLKTTVKIVYLIALPLFVALCFNGGSVRAEGQPNQQHQLDFPVDYTPLKLGLIDGGQPLVPVNINDIQPVTFLADTGTTFSIISTKLAKQMNLTLKPGIGSDGKPILWKGKQATTTTVSVLKVGTVRFTDLLLVVLDAKDISPSPTGHDVNPYQGILGSNLLQQFAILLDTQAHKFIICVPGNLSQGQVGLAGFAYSSALPLTQINFNKWFVTARFVNSGLKGEENLLLDTGSDGTHVSDQLGKEIHLKAQRQRGSRSAYGNITVTLSTVDELDLGDLVLLNFPLSVRPVSENLPPTLGMDILSGYRVLMDFPAKKMYLQSNTAMAVPNITVGPQTPGQGARK